MKYRPTLRSLAPAALGASALLAACQSTVPLSQESPAPSQSAVARAAPQVILEQQQAGHMVKASYAANPRAYRADAAQHIYALNEARIWKGRLPPLLYAIGTLQVEVDGQGQVRSMHWMRAPKHAPEVIAEIERTVRAAAPYPVPAHMGKVVYTDTWLWHKSGRFQLDTLTEGQD